jgi:hypothetical protein
VVERGTHDELLAGRGLYARLYEEQFGNGTIEAHCADGVILSNGRPCRPSSQRTGSGPAGATHDGTTLRDPLADLPIDLRSALRG